MAALSAVVTPGAGLGTRGTRPPGVHRSMWLTAQSLFSSQCQHLPESHIPATGALVAPGRLSLHCNEFLMTACRKKRCSWGWEQGPSRPGSWSIMPPAPGCVLTFLLQAGVCRFRSAQSEEGTKLHARVSSEHPNLGRGILNHLIPMDASEEGASGTSRALP